MAGRGAAGLLLCVCLAGCAVPGAIAGFAAYKEAHAGQPMTAPLPFLASDPVPSPSPSPQGVKSDDQGGRP
jgi:hypothetical protein